ncbi:MAG: glycosyltransferase family 4 protein [Gemmatimonadales bacterium]
MRHNVLGDDAPGQRPVSRMSISVMQVLHQGGGAGSVTSTLHLSLGLASGGLHVRFVCPPDSEVETLARAGGLEVHSLKLERHRRRDNAAKLAALLDRYPVDLINSQSARDREALTWCALTGRLPAPLVVTRRQMPRTFFLENWLMSRLAAQVVAVSRAVGDALIRRGTPKQKLTVIPNGVVTARIDVPVSDASIGEWKARIGWEPGRRTIGIVARPKDQEVVLRALPDVRTPVRLVLAGVEPQSRLGQLAKNVAAPHKVICLAFTPDVRPLYDLLDLVMLPSESEGLSQALLEAMALGKPVIASASTGNLDLVTEGVDGRLVSPRTPRAWAGAIDELLTDVGLARRLGTAARRTARETFGLERTVARTTQLYESLLQGRPRRV